MLNLLIGPVAELAGTWMAGKVEEKKAQAKTKVAKAEAEAIVMQKKATGEIDWDLEMARGSQSSWKDEYLIILLTLPLWLIGWAIAMDDPSMLERVDQGFKALQELPEFYQYLLYTGVLASFGVKGADALMKMRK